MDKCSEEHRAGLRGEFSGAPFFLAAAPEPVTTLSRPLGSPSRGPTGLSRLDLPGVRTPRLTAQNRRWERGTPSSAVI